MSMSVNGISNDPITTGAAYTKSASANNAAASSASTSAASSAKPEDKGVVYESTANKKTTEKATYTPNTNLVNKLKADAEQRTAQFRKMVETMLSKQNKAYQGADSMWQALASGNFTVDKATALNAQKEIGEDGYWGVEQTSDRILSFAEALTGGDPDKMEEMREAFIKGYKQATGAWGRDLPDISSKTYDAVMKKFDDFTNKDTETDSVTKLDTEDKLA